MLLIMNLLFVRADKYPTLKVSLISDRPAITGVHPYGQAQVVPRAPAAEDENASSHRDRNSLPRW